MSIPQTCAIMGPDQTHRTIIPLAQVVYKVAGPALGYHIWLYNLLRAQSYWAEGQTKADNLLLATPCASVEH